MKGLCRHCNQNTDIYWNSACGPCHRLLPFRRLNPKTKRTTIIIEKTGHTIYKSGIIFETDIKLPEWIPYKNEPGWEPDTVRQALLIAMMHSLPNREDGSYFLENVYKQEDGTEVWEYGT